MARKDRLISADVLFDELVELQHSEQSMGIMHSWYPHMRGIVCRQPTVDAVEVVHGRWIRKAHDGAFGVFHLWHCSVCDTIRARQDPYCGECGAKMEVDNG